MKPDKDHIKDIFSSKLKGFEPDLPPSLWGKIEADLPVAPVMKKVPLRNPVYKIFAGTVAAAAVILAVLFLMPEEQRSEKVATLADDNATIVSQPLEKQEIDNSDNSTISDKQAEPQRKHSSYTLLAESKVETKSESQTVLLGEASQEQKVPVKEVVAMNALDKSSQTYVAEEKRSENFEPKDADFDQDLKARIAAFEAEGEKTKNILADNSIPVKPKPNTSESRGLTLGVGGGSGLSKPEEITNSVRYANVYSDLAVGEQKKEKLKMEHNQPISFGIAINKKITKRLSVESGLVYTYISARVKVDPNMEFKQNDLQYFHYLGIPLSLNYKFAELKKFEFYASVGGMVQKDFYGGLHSDSNVDGLINFEKTSKRKISQDRPQFSTMALLGISYPLYNRMSAYTSFGGAYYFEAENTYQTIFSDRKWLFNINLGVKFGF